MSESGRGELFSAAVVTVSDGVAAGRREDSAGPAVASLLQRSGFHVVRREVVADDRQGIASLLLELARVPLSLVVTTGGTGLGPRDVTPEATLEVIERDVPGLAEAIRADSIQKTPHALLSRGVAGIRERTLVINLPGSPRAVRECFEVIRPVLAHAVAQLAGGGPHDKES